VRRHSRFFCILLLIFGFFSVRTHGQDVASITGVVTDSTGGTVSGVSIRLVDTRTGASYTAVTGEDGSYKIPKVSPGPGYVLTATKDGFHAVTVSSLYLPIATTTTKNITLQVGSIAEVVTVTSEGSVSLNTTDSTIGNNFDMRAVEDLPNEFRGSAANLLRLQPAVVSADTANAYDDQGASRNGSVSGARADQDNITVDGIDASN
jgi:Carboxypeptidase regulatory-like domain